jgi:phenylacetate-coenzyme A ligase PaaK-like adenylate-forming protein
MAAALANIAGSIGVLRALVQHSRRLEKEQWLPAVELTARRGTRLQRLLMRAAAAPYYNQVLRDAGVDPGKVELHNLERRPFLDRQVNARHGLDAFLTVDGSGLFSFPWRRMASSSSSCRWPTHSDPVYLRFQSPEASSDSP